MDRSVICGSLEEADIRARLIECRDRVLVGRFPDVPRNRGLLRRTMIDALLRHEPRTIVEFREMITERLISGTDPVQLREALPEVLQLLNSEGLRGRGNRLLTAFRLSIDKGAVGQPAD